jgi:hypothetical protein
METIAKVQKNIHFRNKVKGYCQNVPVLVQKILTIL